MGDYIGFWGGPINGYTTNLVQSSCKVLSVLAFSQRTIKCGHRGPSCSLV